MSPYFAIAIWLISHIICYQICKARKIRPAFPMVFAAAFLGPLAIPLAMALPRKPSAFRPL